MARPTRRLSDTLLHGQPSFVLVVAAVMDTACPQHSDQLLHRPVTFPCLWVPGSSVTFPWRRRYLAQPTMPSFTSVAAHGSGPEPPSCIQWVATHETWMYQGSHLPGQSKAVTVNAGLSATGWPEEGGTQFYWLIWDPKDHQPNSSSAQTSLFHLGPSHRSLESPGPCCSFSPASMPHRWGNGHSTQYYASSTPSARGEAPPIFFQLRGVWYGPEDKLWNPTSCIHNPHIIADFHWQHSDWPSKAAVSSRDPCHGASTGSIPPSPDVEDSLSSLRDSSSTNEDFLLSVLPVFTQHTLPECNFFSQPSVPSHEFCFCLTDFSLPGPVAEWRPPALSFVNSVSSCDPNCVEQFLFCQTAFSRPFSFSHLFSCII